MGRKGEKMVFPEGQGSMKSMVPEGAKIPENTCPAETQVVEFEQPNKQAESDAAAAARGELIQQLG